MKKIKLKDGNILSIPDHPNEDLEKDENTTIKSAVIAIGGIIMGFAVLYDIFHPIHENENEPNQIENL
jgi:hypothetical protein